MTVSMIINYVDNAGTAAPLYAAVLGTKPIHEEVGFAMFPLAGKTTLGLWSRDSVKPASTATGSQSEICVTVGSDAEVDTTRAAWEKLGLKIVQQPTELGFGYTFTAEDPDGNRLRCYTPK
ncbi:VOC family protein [Devosia sp.]|uniref:VOC family protein n=1 Tax=Devosia sp. TaxID=1871048 RepID=UPI003A92AB79